MPSPTRRPLPEQPVAARNTRAGNRPTRLTPNRVVNLINEGCMSVEDGDAAMKTLDHPRLKVARQATFSVRIAIQVPANTRPAAAMACLDTAVRQAVSCMAWSAVVDDSPDGYVIDPPSTTGGSATVRAFLRLTVSVAAYRTNRFLPTARDLLHRDLQQLRQRGVCLGLARRWYLRPRDDEDDPWSLHDGGPDAATDMDDTVEDHDPDELDPDSDDVDPDNYIHCRLYDEDEVFDLDPFDPFHLDPID